MTTVLLTRPASRADRLIGHLEALGHKVLNAPVTQITAAPEPVLPDLNQLAGTLFSSAAAAAYIPEALQTVAKDLPCLAVGPVTAAALSARGWSDVRSFGGEMAALLDALKAQPKGGAWLYPCGQQLAHAPEDMAAQSGANIHPLRVYDASALPDWPPEQVSQLVNTAIEATLFLSVRTAKLFARQVKHAGLWHGGAPGIAGAMSPAIAQAVGSLGYGRVIVSPEKTTSCLVAAMGLS